MWAVALGWVNPLVPFLMVPTVEEPGWWLGWVLAAHLWFQMLGSPWPVGKRALFKCYSEGEGSIYSSGRGCSVMWLPLPPSDAWGWAHEKSFSHSGAAGKLLMWGWGRDGRGMEDLCFPCQEPEREAAWKPSEPKRLLRQLLLWHHSTALGHSCLCSELISSHCLWGSRGGRWWQRWCWPTPGSSGLKKPLLLPFPVILSRDIPPRLPLLSWRSSYCFFKEVTRAEIISLLADVVREW